MLLYYYHRTSSPDDIVKDEREDGIVSLWLKIILIFNEFCIKEKKKVRLKDSQTCLALINIRFIQIQTSTSIDIYIKKCILLFIFQNLSHKLEKQFLTISQSDARLGV